MKLLFKSFSCLLALAMLLASVCTVAFAATPVYGDTNGSNGVDMIDVLNILDHTAGISSLTGDGLTLSDVTFDGVTDVEDALKIMLFFTGEVDSLAPGASGEEGDDIIL